MSKEKQDYLEREASVAFLKVPDKWPNASYMGLYVHVKRRKDDGSMPQTGIVWAAHPLTVWPFKQDNPFEKDQPIKYPSPEAIVADGWVID